MGCDDVPVEISTVRIVMLLKDMDITANQSRFRETEGKKHIRNLLEKNKTEDKNRKTPSPPYPLHALIQT